MIDDWAKKFAFFVHPRISAIEDMGKVFAPISWVANILPPRGKMQFEGWLQSQSVKLSPLSFPCRIKGRKDPIGWIIVIPFMGSQLMGRQHRKRALESMEKGISLAARLGASIVGLGALTAPATHGGNDLLSIAKHENVCITNGNSLTGGVTALAAINAANKYGIDLKDERIAVVGCCGSVGRAVAETLALKGHSLDCVDINSVKLNSLKADLSSMIADGQVRFSETLESIKNCKLVIVATSATQAIIKSEMISDGTVIYDDTQPRNTSIDLLARKNVTVIDGGILEAKDIDFGIDIGLAPHLAYACLGETMLMAKDGRIENHVGDCTWYGASVEVESLQRNSNVLQIAPFRSFNKIIMPRE